MFLPQGFGVTHSSLEFTRRRRIDSSIWSLGPIKYGIFITVHDKPNSTLNLPIQNSLILGLGP